MEMKNEWVKDPKIFNVNRLRATASIHRYASIKELKEFDLGNEKKYVWDMVPYDVQLI